MRFLTYRDARDERVGVLSDSGVHPLPEGRTMLSLLVAGTLQEEGHRALKDVAPVGSAESLDVCAPVPMPPTVRDFMTFERHVEGVARLAGPDAGVAARWYDAPAFYFTNPYAIRGPHDDVPVPPGCTLFDLELEVAAVIGTEGSNLTPEQAEEHIAGYTILVDWSARDIQFTEMAVPLGPVKGKDTATTLGPVLVTPDELSPWRQGTSYDLAMTVDVNGRRIGEDRLSSMAFSFGDMIAYASRGTKVMPGDVLGSGTAGGGCLAELWGRYGFDHHPPLAPGDVVTVSVEQLGTITSRIVGGVDPVPVPRARAAGSTASTGR